MNEGKTLSTDPQGTQPVSVHGARHRRLREIIGSDGLVGMTSSLIASQVLTSGLGLAFWIAAARILSASDVGRLAAATSAISVIATFAVMGIGTLLIAELQRTSESDRGAMFSTAMLVAACGGAVLGLVCVIAFSSHSTSLAYLESDVTTAVVFIAGCAASSVVGAFVMAVLGFKRGRAQLLQNALASGLRLPVFLGLSSLGLGAPGFALFAWVVTLVASLLMAIPLLPRGTVTFASVGTQTRWRLIQRHWRQSWDHHRVNLALTAPLLLMPLIAAFLLSPAQVAHFSVANLIVGALLAVPYFLSVGLFAAGAGDLEHLRARVRQTLPLGLGVGALIVAGLQVGSSLVLQVFGASYASGGAFALRTMALAALPMVIKDHYIAIRRSQSRVGWAARATLVGAAGEIGAAFVGCRFWGIEGLCVGWVVALIGEGVVLGIPVLSFLRGVGPAAAEPR
jgi:O-antigen/teichoic acid export membrane protein